VGRKAKADYVGIALSVFAKKGFKPMKTGELFAAAVAAGLVVGKTTYSSFIQAIHKAPEFDTKVRGMVSFVGGAAAAAAAGPKSPVKPAAESEVSPEEDFGTDFETVA